MKNSVTVQRLKVIRHCEERQRRSNLKSGIASLPSVARNDDETLPRAELLQNSRKITILLPLVIAAIFCLVNFPAYAQENPETPSLTVRDPFENQLPKPEPLPVIEPPKLPAPAEEVITPPRIFISSLMAGGPKPQVIIQGKMLGVGSEVEGAVINGITKEGIEILYKNKTFSIPAPSKTLKFTPPLLQEKKN